MGRQWSTGVEFVVRIINNDRPLYTRGHPLVNINQISQKTSNSILILTANYFLILSNHWQLSQPRASSAQTAKHSLWTDIVTMPSCGQSVNLIVSVVCTLHGLSPDEVLRTNINSVSCVLFLPFGNWSQPLVYIPVPAAPSPLYIPPVAPSSAKTCPAHLLQHISSHSPDHWLGKLDLMKGLWC